MHFESRGTLLGRFPIPAWLALGVILCLLAGKYWIESRASGVIRYTVTPEQAAPRLLSGTGAQSQQFKVKAGQRIVLNYRADIKREHILISVDRMELQRIALRWKRRAKNLNYWNIRQSGAGQLIAVAPADDLYQVRISAVLMAFAGDVEVKWHIE